MRDTLPDKKQFQPHEDITFYPELSTRLDPTLVLKALADETRLRILNLLYDQELCVCDIMAVLQITQTKASRHLIYMKNAGLLADRKEAQWVHYSLVYFKNTNFLHSLVEKTLRTEQLYLEDLKRLSQRIKPLTKISQSRGI